MKFQFLIPFLTLLIGIAPGIFSQSAVELPAGLILSSNGTFVRSEASGPGMVFSSDGSYHAEFDIGSVTDENREIVDLRLYREGELLYNLPLARGADLQVSNSGFVVVYNMDRHFQQTVTLHFLDPASNRLSSETLTYASLFGFSPTGDHFAAGTHQGLNIYDLEGGRKWNLERSSRFAFSDDGRWLVSAFEGTLRVYKEFQLTAEIATGLDYPRGLAVDPAEGLVVVIGKKELMAFDISDMRKVFTANPAGEGNFRDVMIRGGKIMAGVHRRNEGLSQGILQVYGPGGTPEKEEVKAHRNYKTFSGKPVNKAAAMYDLVPWPFEPFDEVHKVWNHYEQHMGDGSGDWSYLHQGLDLEVPIDEPTYAVESGWVKLVLTIGGDAYWRVAISPEQSSGYSDGWLYAHLVPGSIQVEVGDYVELHDYIGDIIYWSADWGHIHFVNIRDQGDIWYYDDDEWAINFNPLLALTPNTDETPPVIEDFSADSKFGFCVNETAIYQDPSSLTGEVDIIAKISDYHGSSDWEQPAYRTYYWIRKHPEGDLVVPKTLGQILNHSYTMYNSSYYQTYAPLMYKKDYLHPSPPWMNHQRDYWQILTNNNGDSIAEAGETALAFNTADYYDGTYILYVEAWDEYGNMAVDSQQVVFFNNNISAVPGHRVIADVKVYPNPAGSWLILEYDGSSAISRIRILDSQMAVVSNPAGAPQGIREGTCSLNVEALPPGVYYIMLEAGKDRTISKFVKR